jgi:hypothetical protein
LRFLAFLDKGNSKTWFKKNTKSRVQKIQTKWSTHVRTSFVYGFFLCRPLPLPLPLPLSLDCRPGAA